MKLTEAFTNLSSDTLLLQSLGDFFNAKIEKCTNAIDELTDMIQNIDVEGYTPPSLNYSFAVTIDGVTEQVLSSDLKNAIMAEAEEFVSSLTGHVVTVDSIIDQLQDSMIANKVMCESLYTLKECGADSIANITSNFINRLQLRMGDVTETASNLGMEFLHVMTQAGASVGDRVKGLLRFIGAYDVPEEVTPDIGLPDCQLSEVTGTNCYFAWFAEVPDNLVDFWNWLVDSVKKLIAMLGKLVEVVVGSSTFRAVKKFVGTLLMTADSFAYADGNEEDLTIDNFGQYWHIRGLQYNRYWLVNSSYTIHGILRNLYQGCYNSAQQIPSNIDTVAGLINELVYYVQNGFIYRDSPVGRAFYYSQQKSTPLPPPWMREDDDPRYTPGSTIYSQVKYVMYHIASRYYQSTSDTPLGILDMLKYTLGAVMDYSHINDEEGFTNHLESNSYLKMELPCSTLYWWLVGNDIYCTRRVTPCVAFSDYDGFDSIEQAVKDSVHTTMYLDIAHRSRVRIELNRFYYMLNKFRSSYEGYIEDDRKMLNAVYASNLIDSLYLKIIEAIGVNGYTPDMDIDYLLIPYNDPTGNDLFWYMRLLVGQSNEDYKSVFNPLTAVDISNKTLLDAIMFNNDNSGQGYAVSDYHVEPLMFLIRWINDDEIYVPFAHVSAITAGRYHVVKDAELADVFVTVIKIAAIVAAVIFAFKMVKKMKLKAVKLRTQADATAWDMVTKGTYDEAAVLTQYKMQKRATLCEKLSQCVFGSVSKVVSSVGSSIKSTVSAMTSKISSVTSGSGVKSTGDAYNFTDLMLLIKGPGSR